MNGLTYISGPSVEPIDLVLAKAHLRVLDTADDSYITHLITASRLAAEKYINQAIGSQMWKDADNQTLTIGLDPVPSDIKAAMLLTIGHLYANRESVTIGSTQGHELPLGVKHLLQPYRVYS
jgi:hypothetical protein